MIDNNEITVLEHGYVHLIAVDGDEQRIADMASISRGNMKGELSLVPKLVEWGHWTPFEFCHLSFQIKAPIFIARQWMRHRTGAFVERSLRYCTEDKLEVYGEDNSSIELFAKLYLRRLCDGDEPETARRVLPLGTYTYFNWCVDLRNLIHFLELRTASGAQLEMQKYAKAVMKFFEVNFPETFKAWRSKHDSH